MAAILTGVRVLDFTWVLAGPFATRLLADFGAEVIKVQSLATAKGAEANLTGYFSAWNRNKRSITLDLRCPEARKIALKLSRISDVVIENFSPRVMENWGLGYERLKQGHPDLVMVSLSALGQTGPWRDYVGFGQTLQALAGLTSLTSYAADAPKGLGYALSDHVSGLYAGLAVLAALAHRDRTGEGCCIDLSEYEAAATLAGPALIDAQAVTGAETAADAAPEGCYPCRGKDCWLALSVATEEQWQGLRRVMGDPAWAKEVGFAAAALRKTHAAALDRRLGAWTAQQDAEDLVARLNAAGVPAAVVQDAQALARDPHLAGREFFQVLDHPVLGTRWADAQPIRFPGDAPDWRPAPLLGEANAYVLGELLGLDQAEISRLEAQGICR